MARKMDLEKGETRMEVTGWSETESSRKLRERVSNSRDLEAWDWESMYSFWEGGANRGAHHEVVGLELAQSALDDPHRRAERRLVEILFDLRQPRRVVQHGDF